MTQGKDVKPDRLTHRLGDSSILPCKLCLRGYKYTENNLDIKNIQLTFPLTIINKNIKYILEQ